MRKLDLTVEYMDKLIETFNNHDNMQHVILRETRYDTEVLGIIRAEKNEPFFAKIKTKNIFTGMNSITRLDTIEECARFISRFRVVSFARWETEFDETDI